MARETLEGLRQERDNAIAARNDLETRLTAATEELGTVTAQRDTAEASVKDLTARNEAQAGEIRTLGASLRAYKGSATKARNEVLVLQREKSPESRPIGAIAATKDDGERRRRRIAFEDALRTGPTELVFSDGRREIRELAPLTIGGDAWRQDARGYTLKPEGHPLLEPGDMTKPSVRIAGFALLDEAGEQIGWHPLVEAIDVARNGRVQLPAGTIRFNF